MTMQGKISKPIHVSFVGSYTPRQCGIATFTTDLVTSLSDIIGGVSNPERAVQVIALNDVNNGYDYGPEVRFEILQQEKLDYKEAAAYLNVSPTEVVCIQHEFGIFGGEDGSYILTLLGNLKKPVVTTLHTVLRQPSDGQSRVLKEICSRSTFVVVQALKAVELLREVYGVPEEKIIFIHHGAPDVPFLPASHFKKEFPELDGRRVLLTFGLLSPNKGIEVAIEALAKVVKEFPDVVYILLGATHPHIKRSQGEGYRESLERLVKERGLTRNVIFYDKFVSLEELTKFLLMTDIYVSPYLSKEQIVSGTLAYAVACGKAIVSTPYWYAEEMLADGRGVLVPFRDSSALAEQLCSLLADENKLEELRKRAYRFGRQMVWRRVATRYLQAFEQALQEYGRVKARKMVHQRAIIPRFSPPEVRLDHLKAMTDETGMLQHCRFTIPDYNHGYCTDDNARAVLVAIRNWRLFHDERILSLLRTYLAFLNHAFNQSRGRFRNFMSYSREWLEEVGSEDCHGRALWALGTAVANAPDEKVLAFATRLFDRALPAAASFISPRAWAYTVLGCIAYLRCFSGAREVRRIGERLAQNLAQLFAQNCSEDWLWGEDIVTYDNARLPQALISAGRWLHNEDMIELGLRSLEWLVKIQTDPYDGHLSLIGNQGWYKRGSEKAQFDQQPIEVAALVDACYEAYLATQQNRWLEQIHIGFNWFLGENDINEPLYDFTTTGCRDGILSSGVNQNQGAESTLSWLLVLHRMHELAQAKPKHPDHSSMAEIRK
ncbi:glycosyltransferase family 4 protein [Candidatus Sumerlaeota bacterium]|nr:glycosyltransferase family 4 protein [Candidatus Sumerlaeota bacterium]